SLFDGNRAEGGDNVGGAIEVDDGTLTVSGSTFNNNLAATGGGAISMQAIQRGGSLNVLTSTFFNNISLSGGGGAINGAEIPFGRGGIDIQGSSFISNFAGCCRGGGAVIGIGVT